MQLGLILSNDWELFGDGSGDYWKLQHARLHELLDAIDAEGAKLTVMAEVGQQWAHRKLNESWARDIADAWEEILIQTVDRKSDVQLHLHPQWLDATWTAGGWSLDPRRWSFASLTLEEKIQVLANGKCYLESLLKAVQPEYRTVLFRAGGFCIEPATDALLALRKVGILADSSVVKGLVDPRFFDYRKAPSHVLPWETHPETVVRVGSGTGIMELPIVSTAVWEFPWWGEWFEFHFGTKLGAIDRDYLQRKASHFETLYPKSRRPMSPPADPHRPLHVRLARKLARPVRFTLDYDALPAPVFAECVERLWEDSALRGLRNTDAIVPVMSIGHAKSVPDVSNLRRILVALKKRLGERLLFWTGQEAVEYWTERLCLTNTEPCEQVPVHPTYA